MVCYQESASLISRRIWEGMIQIQYKPVTFISVWANINDIWPQSLYEVGNYMWWPHCWSRLYPSVLHPTRRWMVDKEMWADKVSWRGKAKGKQQWWSLVLAVYAQGHEEDRVTSEFSTHEWEILYKFLHLSVICPGVLGKLVCYERWDLKYFQFKLKKQNLSIYTSNSLSLPIEEILALLCWESWLILWKKKSEIKDSNLTSKELN